MNHNDHIQGKMILRSTSVQDQVFEIDLKDVTINPMKVAEEVARNNECKMVWFLDAPSMPRYDGKIALVTFKSGMYQKSMPF